MYSLWLVLLAITSPRKLFSSVGGWFPFLCHQVYPWNYTLIASKKNNNLVAGWRMGKERTNNSFFNIQKIGCFPDFLLILQGEKIKGGWDRKIRHISKAAVVRFGVGAQENKTKQKIKAGRSKWVSIWNILGQPISARNMQLANSCRWMSRNLAQRHKVLCLICSFWCTSKEELQVLESVQISQ